MSEFFRGWRRKFGVVTLVMAFVFMVGWVRSVYQSDILTFPNDDYNSEIWHSGGNHLAWVTYARRHPNNLPSWPTWETFQYSERIKVRNAHETAGINWNWRVFGFGYGTLDTIDKSRLTFRIAPYWSIVMPLTLLSTYLLLVKSREAIKNHDKVLLRNQVFGG